MLTDHNRATGAARLGGKVLKIIDHHQDEGNHPEAERIIDTAAGSACSLVALEAVRLSRLHALQVVVLLLSTIAVDCRGLRRALALSVIIQVSRYRYRSFNFAAVQIWLSEIRCTCVLNWVSYISVDLGWY